MSANESVPPCGEEHGSPEFGITVRVFYEDTDAAGIVYHANYLRFMERARTEWLRAAGFDHARLRAEHDLLLTVSRICASYTKPAMLDDELRVTATLEARRAASLVMSQSVRSLSRPATVHCTARARIACIDAATFRPAAIPGAVTSEIERVHGPFPR